MDHRQQSILQQHEVLSLKSQQINIKTKMIQLSH